MLNIPQRKRIRAVVKEIDPRQRTADEEAAVATALADAQSAVTAGTATDEQKALVNPNPTDTQPGTEIPDFSKMTEPDRQVWVDKMKAGDPALKALLETEGDRRVEQGRDTMEKRILADVKKTMADERAAADLKVIEASGDTKKIVEAQTARIAELELEKEHESFRANAATLLNTAGAPELLELITPLLTGGVPSMETIAALAKNYTDTRAEAVARDVAKNLGTGPTPPGQPPQAPPGPEVSIADMTDAQWEEERKNYPGTED